MGSAYFSRPAAQSDENGKHSAWGQATRLFKGAMCSRKKDGKERRERNSALQSAVRARNSARARCVHRRLAVFERRHVQPKERRQRATRKKSTLLGGSTQEAPLGCRAAGNKDRVLSFSSLFAVTECSVGPHRRVCCADLCEAVLRGRPLPERLLELRGQVALAVDHADVHHLPQPKR